MNNEKNEKTRDKELLDFYKNQGQVFVTVPDVNVRWKQEKENYLYESFVLGNKLRSLFNNEIFIEFDNNPEYIFKIEEKLKKLEVQYAKFDHGGRSPWLRIYNIKGLEKLSPEDNVNYRKSFFKTLGISNDVDVIKKPRDSLVPIEFVAHWKHEKIHDLVSGIHPLKQRNNLLKEVISMMKNSTQKENLSNTYQPNWESDQLINFSINGKVGTGENKNNILFKLIAIRLKDMGISSYDLHKIADKICQNCKGHKISEIITWYDLVVNENYEWNALEANKYIKKYNLPIQKYPLPFESNQEIEQNVSDKLVDLAFKDITEIFTDQHGVAYCQIQIGDHLEEYNIGSPRLKNWLSKTYWDETHKTPNVNALINALNILESKAVFEGKEYNLFNRCCLDSKGNIYVDLCDEKWAVVKISQDNCEILDNRPIMFKRYAHQKPLFVELETNPEQIINSIFNFIPILNEDSRLLQKVALITLPLEAIPKPIINYYGDQGSGKSTVTKILRKLIDPSSIGLLSFNPDRSEIIQQLDHHYCSFYDNVSRINDSTSDILCRACTGEGFTKRMLYSNDEDLVRSYRRPVVLNGINVAARKPDLLDRSILIRLERIQKSKRKTENELNQEFIKIQPKITGAIFSILSKAIKIYPSVKIAILPRMADFARWGEAVSRALGYEEGKFLNAYWANLEIQNSEAIEAHPIGFVLLRFIEDNLEDESEFKPGELLEKLQDKAEKLQININKSHFPRAANSLTRRINEIKTNFLDRGIFIETGVHTSEGNKIHITKSVRIPSEHPLPSESPKMIIEEVVEGEEYEDSINQNIHTNLQEYSQNSASINENEDTEGNEGISSNTKFLHFNENIPSFVGDDLKNYGPFEAGDQKLIPIKAATILLDSKAAEEVK